MAINLALATGSGATITNTETSLTTTGGTTTGVPQSQTNVGLICLILDGVANMAKGDEFTLKIYEKARASGTQRVIFSATISDAQSQAYMTPNLLLGIGWDITLQRTGGSNRAFDWSVRIVG